MQLRYSNIYPLIVAFGAGFALIVLGYAFAAPMSHNWLGFAGSLLGSALAAGTGYWLIIVKEAREKSAKVSAVAEAIEEILQDFRKLQAVLEGKEHIYNPLYLRLSQHDELLNTAARAIEGTSLRNYMMIETLRIDLKYDWHKMLEYVGFLRDDFDFEEQAKFVNVKICIDQMMRECILARSNCEAALNLLKGTGPTHAAISA